MDACNRVKVVKIYKSQDELESDNNKNDLMIDSAFETIVDDMEIYNLITDKETMTEEQLNNQFMSELQKYYPFENNNSLQVKISSVMENLGKYLEKDKAYRKINDGEYCMLINLSDKIFYKRVRDIWIIQDMKSINDNICNSDFLNIIEKSANSIIKDFMDETRCQDNPDFTACLPSKLLIWAEEIGNLKEIITSLKNKHKEVSEIDDATAIYQQKIKNNIHRNKLKI